MFSTSVCILFILFPAINAIKMSATNTRFLMEKQNKLKPQSAPQLRNIIFSHIPNFYKANNYLRLHLLYALLTTLHTFFILGNQNYWHSLQLLQNGFMHTFGFSDQRKILFKWEDHNWCSWLLLLLEKTSKFLVQDIMEQALLL